MRLDLFKEQLAEAGKPLEPTGERSYLGLSGWHSCQRNLYHKAKGTPRKPIESRIYRIFKQGHDIEDQTVNLLKQVPNILIEEVDPETGKQFEVQFFGGHVKGHFDFRCRSEYYFGETTRKLGEIKSANDKNFKMYQKKGVQQTNETYYAQVQCYMHGTQDSEHWKDHALIQCLFIVFNKNTAELYIEIIDYNKLQAEHYIECFKNALQSQQAPEKYSDNPTFYMCRFCDFHEVCHGDKVVELEKIKQCKNIQPNMTSGNWFCTKTDCEFYKQPVRSLTDKCQSIKQ